MPDRGPRVARTSADRGLRVARTSKDHGRTVVAVDMVSQRIRGQAKPVPSTLIDQGGGADIHPVSTADTFLSQPGGFWAYFFTFLVQDLSQQVRNGRRIHGDRFSGRTVDSGPISSNFWCFWHDLKIRSGPNLAPKPQPGARNPQPGLQIPELFFWAPFQNIQCISRKFNK